MIIVIIDESLEVADLDLLPPALALHQRIKLKDHPIPIGP